MGLNKFDGMSDFDLLHSVGSHRPAPGFGLGELVRPMSADEMAEAQREYDEAVEEMNRRDRERGFPFHIPKAKGE